MVFAVWFDLKGQIADRPYSKAYPVLTNGAV
jgi:hypothetical protein